MSAALLAGWTWDEGALGVIVFLAVPVAVVLLALLALALATWRAVR